MIATTLAASIAFSIASAAAFGTVALVLSRREVSAPMRSANRAFVIWWAALSASALLTGLQTTVAAAGYRSIAFFTAVGIVNILLVCLALWGLLHYLLVLIAGVRSFAAPLGILYAGLAAYFAYLVMTTDYTHVELGRWSAMLAPSAVFEGPALILLVALIIGPQLVAAFAYLALVFRVEDPMARKRILIVSLSIIVWFGAAVLVAFTSEPGATPSDAWELTSRLLGLGAAGAVLYAYAGLTPRVGSPTPTPADGANPPAVESKEPGRRLAPALQAMLA